MSTKLLHHQVEAGARLVRLLAQDIQTHGPTAEADHPVLFESVRQLFPFLAETDLRKIVVVATRVCPHCHEQSRRSCACMLDY